MIIIGSQAKLKFTIMTNGEAVAIPSNATITSSIYTADGMTELVSSAPCSPTHDLADWDNGVVGIDLLNTQTSLIPAGLAMVVIAGDFGVKRFKIYAETLSAPTRSALFIRDFIIDELRSDRLVAANAGAFPATNLSDDYLWDKILAAESEIKNTLRVPLVPTQFFTTQPTQEQIDALNGMPWELESAPDYVPEMFMGDRWGYIVTRNKPIISVTSMRFVYPTEQAGFYEIPLEWLSIDHKYGHIRIVPTSSAILTGLAGLSMLGVVAGRVIPGMVRINYVAGLADAAKSYPELIDAIKKLAVVKLFGDTFMPQSGSISADGLSESISSDVSKYQDMVDHIINGGAGSNGGLMAAIHGVRLAVL